MHSFARLAQADLALWIGRGNIQSALSWTLYVPGESVSAHGGRRQSASFAEASRGPVKRRVKKRGTRNHRGRHARRKMKQAVFEEAVRLRAERHRLQMSALLSAGSAAKVRRAPAQNVASTSADPLMEKIRLAGIAARERRAQPEKAAEEKVPANEHCLHPDPASDSGLNECGRCGNSYYLPIGRFWACKKKVQPCKTRH